MIQLSRQFPGKDLSTRILSTENSGSTSRPFRVQNQIDADRLTVELARVFHQTS